MTTAIGRSPPSTSTSTPFPLALRCRHCCSRGDGVAAGVGDDVVQVVAEVVAGELMKYLLELKATHTKTSGMSLTDVFKVKVKVKVIETNMSMLCHA